MQLFFLLFLSMILSCKSLTIELKKLPEEDRKIYLENFTNQTFEPLIHQEFYNHLRERIHQKNSLIIVEEKKNSNYYLSGSILLFRREGFLYDNEMLPNAYQIDSLIEIRIYDNKNVLLEKFEFYDSIRYSLKEGWKETDPIARIRLYDRMTYKIVPFIEKTIYEDYQRKNDTKN